MHFIRLAKKGCAVVTVISSNANEFKFCAFDRIKMHNIEFT